MRCILPKPTLLLFLAVIVFGSIACTRQGLDEGRNIPADAVAADIVSIEPEIKELVNQTGRAMASNDVAAFDRMAADDYIYVGPNGSVANKAERLEAMKADDSKFESIVFDDINVRVRADGSGAISVSRATVKGTVMGEKIDSQFRLTQVWSRSGDGWKLVHGQAVPIASYRTPSSSDGR